MRGLLSRIYQEVRWPVLLFATGLSSVMALLTTLLPKVLGDIHRVFERMPFVKPLITALLGVDPGDQMSATMSQAFLWVHPTVLTITWAHEVMYCTRVPAGEIDRGTIDFLLGLPVSRWKVFLSETIGWMLSGLLILALGYAGHLIAATWLQPDMRPPLMTTFFVMTNFYAVYLAVGAFSFLVSSCSDRRGRAMGVIFAVLLLSFIVNFVAQFWDPLSSKLPKAPEPPSFSSLLLDFDNGPTDSATNDIPPPAAEGRNRGLSIAAFSIMEYYRPAIIIQSGQFPASDVLILLAIAIACWLSAGIVFHRRSICTV